MAIFPKIQSPCPYVDRLSSLLDGDMCRMCKRQVVDLSAWSDDERVAFMKGCAGEVCVSYKIRLRPVIAAAALAAAIAAPTAAAAQDAMTEVVIVMGGGITDPKNVEYVTETGDRAVPDLPVVYEGEDPGTS
jgi:predicted Fe-S protein YdhL (DUF1289 family)